MMMMTMMKRCSIVGNVCEILLTWHKMKRRTTMRISKKWDGGKVEEEEKVEKKNINFTFSHYFDIILSVFIKINVMCLWGVRFDCLLATESWWDSAFEWIFYFELWNVKGFTLLKLILKSWDARDAGVLDEFIELTYFRASMQTRS